MFSGLDSGPVHAGDEAPSVSYPTAIVCTTRELFCRNFWNVIDYYRTFWYVLEVIESSVCAVAHI